MAVDNAPVPGYKVYLDERGERPEVAITFLNIRPSAGCSVNGVVIRVSAAEFAQIRRRERNYRLVDLSAALRADRTVEPGEPIYASVGRPEAIARFDAARRSGRAVVVCAYRERVERAFCSLGDAAFAAYTAGTEPFEGACLPLRRVDLP